MNRLLSSIITSISLLLLVACSQKNSSLSSNSEMNRVSPQHTTQKPGYMQSAMDSWLKEEWEPTLAKDENIQKKYMKKEELKTENSQEVYKEDEERAFTLQEYMDKAVAYSKANPSDHNNSHVKKLNEMPVIGK